MTAISVPRRAELTITRDEPAKGRRIQWWHFGEEVGVITLTAPSTLALEGGLFSVCLFPIPPLVPFCEMRGGGGWEILVGQLNKTTAEQMPTVILISFV